MGMKTHVLFVILLYFTNFGENRYSSISCNAFLLNTPNYIYRTTNHLYNGRIEKSYFYSQIRHAGQVSSVENDKPQESKLEKQDEIVSQIASKLKKRTVKDLREMVKHINPAPKREITSKL